MPITGEKSTEYPFGYGYCVCGCGKPTKDGLRFFRWSHNPRAVEIRRESARKRANRVEIRSKSEQRHVRQEESFRKLALQLERREEWERKLAAQRERREERKPAPRPADSPPAAQSMFNGPDVPLITPPTGDAVAKELANPRLAHAVAWSKANPEFIKWHRTKLRAKSNETAKRYQRERRKVDPLFKLIAYVRGRIRAALSRKTARKSEKTQRLLGCSAQELQVHLESLFMVGMSWENYGEWHVDHIKPCCTFDLTKPEEQRACFHFSNLQPLWAMDNFKKNGRDARTRLNQGKDDLS